MSKGSTFANDLLKLIFNATPIGGLADNANLSPLGNLYVSLHTDDPGADGDQTASEGDYGGYARVAVSRSGSGWTVTGNSAFNTALVQFPKSTGGSNNITHVGVGAAESGEGKLFYSGPLDEEILVTINSQPQFGAGELEFTED